MSTLMTNILKEIVSLNFSLKKNRWNKESS